MSQSESAEAPLSNPQDGHADSDVKSSSGFRIRLRVLIAFFVSVTMAAGIWFVLEQNTEKPDFSFVEPEGGQVMYLPTPQDVVERMLELAEVSKESIVYDLGCGDGRVLVTAAKKYGCKCRGYEIDPKRVHESLKNAKRNNVEDLITVDEKDIFTLDLSEADVIFLYLLPKLNVRLIPQLKNLKPGTRIVSHLFDMKGVKPEKVLHWNSPEDGHDHPVYLWRTPLEMETKVEKN